MQASVISGIREYLNGCPLLSDFKDRHIDWTDAGNENYGVIIDGETPIKKFINGGGKFQYAFSLYINKVSAEDEQALRNAEFIENLQKWCREMNINHHLPELPDGCTASRIEAVNGMLAEIPKSRKYGKYIIQFKLFYIRRV